MTKLYVIKASGKRVKFNANKIIRTCMRAGTTRKRANQIVKKILEKLHDNSTTIDIYRLVLKELAADNSAIFHRYRLKESLMKLGPAGFHFESFMTKVFQNYGYSIEGTGKFYQGKCIRHEIDISGTDPDKRKILIECKYHNHRGIFTKLKESLYTHARFIDLQDKFEKEMLVTNTKISRDAKSYANCIGQKLLAWRFPKDNGLEQIIQQKGLYPITILRLKSSELDTFAVNNIIFAKELVDVDLYAISKKTNISLTRLKRLQNLVNEIISDAYRSL